MTDSRLEELWRGAAMKYPVCILSGVTKSDVIYEISEGADTLEKLKEKLPLCRNNECAAHSPAGCGCKENAEALLEIYAPVWKMMNENKCSCGKNKTK